MKETHTVITDEQLKALRERNAARAAIAVLDLKSRGLYTLDGKPGYKPVLRPSAPPSWRWRPMP